ncbi:hypothetical protein L1987_08900 [Smallanthus sonchifolius]|uniref:Uncharacterized protein n=1 Tax=Smallanthus sonchifolius TaxID=185202 RepID=A0ACB9JLH2_9ASTR|nr:hypothetical protein L1987_08900 [Smallanthus sonchifolius]
MERLASEDSVNDELEKLHLACKDWGFFQIINHGVSCSLVERGFGQAFVVSGEQKLDWADIFFLVTLPHHIRKPHLFPNLPLPFRDTLEAYSRELKNTAIKTLYYIANALKMDTKDLMVLFEEGMQ